MGPLQCHQNPQIGGLSFTKALIPCDTPPHSLKDSNVNPKVKRMEEEKVSVRFLAPSTLRVEGCARVSGWGLKQMTSGSIIHTNLHNPNNKLVSACLEHFWCTDKP